MELSKYIACLCEGTAEEVIVSKLLGANLLIFTKEDLLDGELIRTRGGESFERRYLKRGYTGKITVLRVLDSRRERFVLSNAYKDKIDVVNVITAPEIEMLIILCEGKYESYKRSGKKPSDFCKTELRMSKVKSRAFVEKYFCDIDALVEAIKEYHRVSNIPAGEYTLSDLLK